MARGWTKRLCIVVAMILIAGKVMVIVWKSSTTHISNEQDTDEWYDQFHGVLSTRCG